MTITHEQSQALGRYAGRIRNPAKRTYALSYGKWLLHNRSYSEPRPPASLSFMGTQAVRLNMAEILN